MPEVNAGAVQSQLRKALDAQGRVQEAAKAAAQEAAAVRERPPAEPPKEERKP